MTLSQIKGSVILSGARSAQSKDLQFYRTPQNLAFEMWALHNLNYPGKFSGELAGFFEYLIAPFFVYSSVKVPT